MRRSDETWTPADLGANLLVWFDASRIESARDVVAAPARRRRLHGAPAVAVETAMKRQRITDVQAELASLSAQLGPKNAARVDAAMRLITDLKMLLLRRDPYALKGRG